MTNKQPRFNRRFLTILMLVTAAAILILSRIQPPLETSEQQEHLPQPAGTHRP
ncbi:MAG: hypothetical protein H6995_14940 [Pseudomonadales bacterium]|nr:hypothetical protein [Pseudomonadales bacterium]MCP5216295.1 hypothetical protein [Pseudomonadales bacterium]